MAPPRTVRRTSGPSGAPLLDDVGKAILRQLQQDGRRSYTAIGPAVGLSEAAVRQRVKALVDSGVLQIVAGRRPDHARLRGDGDRRRRGVGDAREAAETISRIAEVDYCVLTSGRYDLQLELVCRDNEHLLSVINDRIRTVPGCGRPRPPSACGCTSRPTTTAPRTDGSPDQPALRPALPADAPALARCHVACWRETYGSVLSAALLAALDAGLYQAHWEQRLAERQHLVLVSVVQGEVIGFAVSGPGSGRPAGPRPGAVGPLHAHAVLRDRPRSGSARGGGRRRAVLAVGGA
jgi:Lrp/AsnC family transcriptional regulator for asnA, asnC and gidA